MAPRPRTVILAASDDPAEDLLRVAIQKLDDLEEAVGKRGNGGNGNGGGLYVPRWVLLIAGPLVTTLLVALTTLVVSLDRRVSIAESTHATHADVERRARQIEMDVPPDRVERLLDHERRLERLERIGPRTDPQ